MLKKIEKYTYDDEDSLLTSQQKEIFNKLVDEKLDKITKLGKKVNHDSLIYRCKRKTPDKNFNTYDNALDVIDKIKNRKVKLAHVKNDQIKLNLSDINRGPKKSKEQKNVLRNVEML